MIRISRDDCSEFVVPPEDQGQIVEVSYAQTDGAILRRSIDRSDGDESITAYHYARSGAYEPWNRVPKLGRRIGRVVLV